MTAAHELLPWQAADWQRIAAPLRAGRLPHALLLTGARGIGKQHFANVVARALLCAEPGVDGLPCGACPGCVQVTAGSHPDVAMLAPDQAGGVIKIDAIRQFVHTLYLTAQNQHGRVGFIQPADRMTPAAANSLLKALEEPPAGSHILLISDRPSALLATIRSRCQRLRLAGADAALAQGWLEQQATGAATLLPLSCGAPLRAARMTDLGIAEVQSTWFQTLGELASGKRDPVAVAETWLTGDPDTLLDWLYLVSVDVLKICAGADREALLFGAQSDEIAAIAAAMDAWKFQNLMPTLLRTRRLRTTQADFKLSLESLCIQLFECRHRRHR